MRNFFLWVLLAAGTAACCLAYDCADRRVREARAMSCAKASAGTDQAIAECFERFGLEARDLY